MWHDFAKIWQTPGEGEAFWTSLREAPPADTAALLVSLGVPEIDAPPMVEALDEVMVSCVLDLYRAATSIERDRGGDVSTTAPDSWSWAPPTRSATRLGHEAWLRGWGAEVAVLGGLGHWWPLEGPDVGASALGTFLGPDHFLTGRSAAAGDRPVKGLEAVPAPDRRRAMTLRSAPVP